MTTSAGARRLATALVAAMLAAATPGDADEKKAPGWTPPGLSREERAEWKDGRPPGWSQGLKRGWKGKDCPPGLAKKGRCQPREVAGAPPQQQKTWEEELRERIERLRKWGRDTMKLPPPTLTALLIGFEGAARHGVPLEVAERVATGAAERGLSALAIEQVTRALAYGADRGAQAADLEAFARQGLQRGVAAEAIALGLYRLAAEAKP
jgi:hypothetical protein